MPAARSARGRVAVVARGVEHHEVGPGADHRFDRRPDAVAEVRHLAGFRRPRVPVRAPDHAVAGA